MKRKSRKIVGIIIPVVISLIIGTFFHFFPVFIVDENSQDKFHINQLVLVSSLANIEPGDLIVFEYEGETLIRRCIGVAGDQITIDPDGIVYVNDVEIDESYVINLQDGSDDIYPFLVPIDRYFVLNDDRSNLADSRSIQFGSVSTQQVIGKVIFK